MVKPKQELPRVITMDKANGNVYVVEMLPRQSIEYVRDCTIKKFRLNKDDCISIVTSNRVQFFPDGVAEWKEAV